ncbi:MAG: substrate-binding domain-containing protein [Roseobacter sp.]
MNLKQLSQELSLSPTTVSRALNGYPEVNEATRKRVAEAAEKFQYRPNARAQTLATGKSKSIGHIISMSNQAELVNMVFSDFVAGAGLVYANHGYTMTLKIVPDDAELAAYRALSERGTVDGVIVQAPACNDPRIDCLASLDIPFVVHGRASDVTSPYAWLDVNNQRAIDTLTTHLTDLGHRRIALVNGRETLDFAARRRAGFSAALTRVFSTVDPTLMRSGDMSEPNGYDAARALLSLPHPPTAFVASSVVLALGVKRAVEERGLGMGKDVSIVCFDDDISYLPNAGATPQFTAMRSSVRAAGARCAELLLAQITNPHSSSPAELWEAEFVQGRSSGPAPTGPESEMS